MGIIWRVTIGVYGLGRFGAMWSQLLARSFDVVAYSRDEERPAPPGVARRSELEVARADALFLCVAISAMPEVCARLQPLLGASTLVMDTCSVKVLPARVMEEAFPAPRSVIATHPMFGPDSARQGLAGLPIVLCPVRSGEDELRSWTATFERLGLAVIVMSPEEHDRRAAYSQGITHLLGRVLADMQLGPSPISTLGYRRLLEIIEQTCNDSWQLFVDLQRLNPYTAEMRSRLRESIEKVMRRLEP